MLWMKVIRDPLPPGEVDNDKLGSYTVTSGVNERTLGAGRIENYSREYGWEQLIVIAALEVAGMEEPTYMDHDQQLIDHEVKNLLAILHRDGGHYTNEHGMLNSLKDAQDRIHKEWKLTDA